MTNWHVGMKVVCVNAGPTYNPHPRKGGPIVSVKHLQEGSIYTITKVSYPTTFDGPPGLRLAEAPDYRIGLGYLSTRFRPAVERKTDISIFTRMLTPSRVDA